MPSPWYERKLDEILKEVRVDPAVGLSSSEVKEREVKYGMNLLPRGKKVLWWELFLRQFINPLILILLIAALLTISLDERVDFYVISLAVLVNISIGFWQEFRSNQIFEKLEKLVQARARVRRNAEIIEIDMFRLVPGDIILLRTDTKVPADARLISAQNLTINEAILTGESKGRKKQVGDLKGTVSIGDRINMVHMGTIIERGEGEAVVVGTGLSTEIGQIAALTASVKDEKTPLQHRLAGLGKRISLLVGAFTVIIFAFGFYEYRSSVELFKVAVAVAVAAIPEGLPAALSVVLAVSATRILRRRGLVKKLIGAETLGSTSIIVTDKTGTLTEGKMKVVSLLKSPNEKRAAIALALSSDTVRIKGEKGEETISGEATDKAKVEFFLEQGGNLDRVLKEYRPVALLSFDPVKKYLASFYETGKSQYHLFISGAPEVILDLSKISDKTKEAISREVGEYASRGFRMIGIAERELKNPKDLNPENLKSLESFVGNLVFLGVAALRDPIRNDVKEAMAVTRKAGVQVLMATGDHRLTALAVGQELGFNGRPETVINGDDMDHMTDEELLENIQNHVEIFSRVSPSHKMRITKILKKAGAVVAMTGDGVNDAPALRASDIGISLGSGSDITKETADLVLLDDSFSIITAAIREGRIAFDNMRKVTVFLLSNSFTEIIIILAALFMKTAFLPVTAVQILWANLVEDSFPNFALAFEPGEKGVMDRKPFKRKEPILDKQGLSIVFIVGILSDLMLVGIFYYLYFHSLLPSERIQTLMFSLLTINSLFIVFAIKSYHQSIFKTKLTDNKYLIFAVSIGFFLTGAAIYAPFLQNLLGTVPLKFSEVLIVLALAIFQAGSIELVKWWFRKRETFGFKKKVVS